VGAALLLDQIYAQLVADGVHLHPAIVDMIVRLKTPKRAVLITDAIRGAGMPDGNYELGGNPIIVKEGAVYLAPKPGGKDKPLTLAGSCLTMDTGVRNLTKFTSASLPECLEMATLTPARSIGVSDRKGSLETGKDADIVLLDTDLNVVSTIVLGEVVHPAER
jgi:N-acetylglucosamine-6-phosphate deacetylase